MRKLLLIPLLVGCTLDPEAPLEETELQVTVVGINPSAHRVTVALTSPAEGTPLARFDPAVAGERIDVWFRALPVGDLELWVETDDGQACERLLRNDSGPQQEVVDLQGTCAHGGGEGGEGGEDDEGEEGEDDHEGREE